MMIWFRVFFLFFEKRGNMTCYMIIYDGGVSVCACVGLCGGKMACTETSTPKHPVTDVFL